MVGDLVPSRENGRTVTQAETLLYVFVYSPLRSCSVLPCKYARSSNEARIWAVSLVFASARRLMLSHDLTFLSLAAASCEFNKNVDQHEMPWRCFKAVVYAIGCGV